MIVKSDKELAELNRPDRDRYRRIKKAGRLTQGFCGACGIEGDWDYCPDAPNCYYTEEEDA